MKLNFTNRKNKCKELTLLAFEGDQAVHGIVPVCFRTGRSYVGKAAHPLHPSPLHSEF